MWKVVIVITLVSPSPFLADRPLPADSVEVFRFYNAFEFQTAPSCRSAIADEHNPHRHMVNGWVETKLEAITALGAQVKEYTVACQGEEDTT